MGPALLKWKNIKVDPQCSSRQFPLGWMVSKLVERTTAWYRRGKNVIQRCYNTFGKIRHKSRIEPWLGCMYYVPKSSFLSAGTGVWKISSVACVSIKIDYSDYLKSLISRINEAYAFSIKYRYSDILLKKHKLCFAAITLFIVLRWFL